jgi:hypothetical protein
MKIKAHEQRRQGKARKDSYAKPTKVAPFLLRQVSPPNNSLWAVSDYVDLTSKTSKPLLLILKVFLSFLVKKINKYLTKILILKKYL